MTDCIEAQRHCTTGGTSCGTSGTCVVLFCCWLCTDSCFTMHSHVFAARNRSRKESAANLTHIKERRVSGHTWSATLQCVAWRDVFKLASMHSLSHVRAASISPSPATWLPSRTHAHCTNQKLGQIASLTHHVMFLWCYDSAHALITSTDWVSRLPCQPFYTSNDSVHTMFVSNQHARGTNYSSVP